MPRSNRTLIAYALSQLTGIQFLRGRTMYEWSKIYDIASKDDFGWKNIFLVSSSSLIERIESEWKTPDSFIFDGATFSDLMYLRLTHRDKTKGEVNSERSRIMTSLENICFSYAAHHYDMVIHLETPAEFQTPHETELFERMFDGHKIPYQIYDGTLLKDTLEKIVAHLELPTVMEVENALCKANQNLYINK